MAGETLLDPDGDDLSNLAEQAAGTDPGDPDTDGDGDGFDDGIEIKRGSNPLDDQSVPVLNLPSLGPWGLTILILSIAIVPFRRRRRRAAG